jgi:hypothetical protein
MNPPPPVTSARIFGPLSMTRAGRLASSSSALYVAERALFSRFSWATMVASVQRSLAGQMFVERADGRSGSTRSVLAEVNHPRVPHGAPSPSSA